MHLIWGFQRMQQRSVRYVHTLKELRISCIPEQWWHIIECHEVGTHYTGRLERIIHVKISGGGRHSLPH